MSMCVVNRVSARHAIRCTLRVCTSTGHGMRAESRMCTLLFSHLPSVAGFRVGNTLLPSQGGFIFKSKHVLFFSWHMRLECVSLFEWQADVNVRRKCSD